MFTKDQLDGFTKEKLCALGGYYGVEVNMRMLKGEIIAEIMKLQKDEAEKPQMSVRVKRILEQTRSE